MLTGNILYTISINEAKKKIFTTILMQENKNKKKVFMTIYETHTELFILHTNIQYNILHATQNWAIATDHSSSSLSQLQVAHHIIYKLQH